jgi:hypothetical protein
MGVYSWKRRRKGYEKHLSSQRSYVEQILKGRRRALSVKYLNFVIDRLYHSLDVHGNVGRSNRVLGFLLVFGVERGGWGDVEGFGRFVLSCFATGVSGGVGSVAVDAHWGRNGAAVDNWFKVARLWAGWVRAAVIRSGVGARADGAGWFFFGASWSGVAEVPAVFALSCGGG